MEARTLGTEFGGALTFRGQREKGQPWKEREEWPERWEENQERAGPWGLWRERWVEEGGLACPYLKGLSLPWDCHLETPAGEGGQGPAPHPLVDFAWPTSTVPAGPHFDFTQGPHPQCMFPSRAEKASLSHITVMCGASESLRLPWRLFEKLSFLCVA